MSEPAIVVLVIVLVLFHIGFLMFVIRMVAGNAGFVANSDFSSLGEFRESYGTGSLQIGMISFSNCLTVDRYEHGYLIQLWKILGGGERAILFSDVVSTTVGHYLRFMDSTTLGLDNGDELRFFGKVARKIVEDRYSN